MNITFGPDRYNFTLRMGFRAETQDFDYGQRSMHHLTKHIVSPCHFFLYKKWKYQSLQGRALPHGKDATSYSLSEVASNVSA